MPPVIGAVISIGAAIATKFVASAIVKALITVAASLATSLLLSKKPKNVNKLNQGAELRTKIDPTMTRQVLGGLIATGGSCHFVYTGTNDSKKPNRYLYRVIQLSDRPINALVRVMDGTDVVGFAGDVTTGWRASTSYLSKSGAACMWMRVYLGSDTPTADSTLISETGGLWTSAHKGTGLAYAIIKMDNDADAFPSGEPEFTWVVQGAKVYDDRLDSTRVGGSGPQRLNNYSTWGYSETASLITAQFLRGFYTNGVRIVGVGAEDRDLPTSMLFSAHNTCEQAVTVNAGTEARYVAGMVMSASDQAASILEDLQAAMDGQIYDRGGSITILPGANRTPVLALNDQDIIWTEQKSWQPKASLEAMLNCVAGNFIDRDANFAEGDVPIFKNAQWELDDGGERFATFFSYRAVNKRSQAIRINKRIHNSSRYSGTCAFVGGIWLLEIEQGDWVTLTSARWGFSTKYFEVQEITLTKDIRVALVLREVSPNIDEWDHSVDETPRSDTIWNSPTYTLPTPAFTLSKQRDLDLPSGQQQWTVEVAVTDAATYGAFVKRFEAEVSIGSTSNSLALAPFTPDQAKTRISGLAPALTYYVRVRTSDGTRSGTWSSWSSIVTDNSIEQSETPAIYDPFDYATVADVQSTWTVTGPGASDLSIVATTDTGGKSFRIGNNSGNDEAWAIDNRRLAYSPEDLYEVTFDVEGVGAGTVYLGVVPYNAAGAAISPSDAGTYCFQAAANAPQLGRKVYRGYFRGTAAVGSSNNVGGTAPDPASPTPLPTNTASVSMVIIGNYTGATGSLTIHEATLRKVQDNVVIPTGAWSSARTYYRNEGVSYQGRYFGSLVNDNLNHTPPTTATSNAYWYLISDKGIDGVNGVSAYSGLLTNESHTLPADSSGNITSYTGAGGNFKVYYGATDVTANFTFTVQSNPQGLTATTLINSSGVYTVTGGFDAGEAVATITYRATGTGSHTGVVIDRTFSLAKSQAGAAGTPPPLITLTASTQQAKYDSNDAYVGGNIVFDAVLQNVPAGPGSQIAFSLVRKSDGATLFAGPAALFVSTSPTVWSSSGPTNLVLLAAGVDPLVDAHGTFRMIAYSDNATVNDSVTVQKVKDGATGAGLITLVNKANVTITGNTITKTGGAVNTWDASGHSLEGYAGDVQASAQYLSGTNLMIGLNSDPNTDASYTSGDAFAYTAGGSFYAYVNGTGYGPHGTVTVGDFLYARRRGDLMEWGILGEPQPRVSSPLSPIGITPTTKLYFDSAFWDIGGSVGSVSIIPLGSDASPGFHLININASLVTANSVSFSGTGATWSGKARTQEGYRGAAVGAMLTRNTGVGLTTDPAVDNSYGSVDYWFHRSASGSIYLYRNGVVAATMADPDAATPDVPSGPFIAASDTKTVRYYHKGVELTTWAHAANSTTETLFGVFNGAADSALITQIAFSAAGAAGTNGTNGVSPILVTLEAYSVTVGRLSSGAAKPGQLPKTVRLKVTQAGVDLTGSASVVLTPSDAGSIAASYSNPNITITQTDAQGYIDVAVTVAGNLIDTPRIGIILQKDSAPPQTSNTDTEPFGLAISNTSFFNSTVAPNNVYLAANASGQIALSFSSEYTAQGAASVQNFQLQVQMRYRVAGSGSGYSTFGAVQTGNTAQTLASGDVSVFGALNFSFTVSGLTPGALYEIGPDMRRSAGTSGAVADINGSMTVNQ